MRPGETKDMTFNPVTTALGEGVTPSKEPLTFTPYTPEIGTLLWHYKGEDGLWRRTIWTESGTKDIICENWEPAEQ